MFDDKYDNFGTEQSHKIIIIIIMTGGTEFRLSGSLICTSARSLSPAQLQYSYDKRQVAARTLGDLVRKLGGEF